MTLPVRRPGCLSHGDEVPGPGARVPWRGCTRARRAESGLRAAAAELPASPGASLGTRLGRLQVTRPEEQARRPVRRLRRGASLYFDRHPGFFLGLCTSTALATCTCSTSCAFRLGQEADYWGLGESALAT